MSAPRRKPTLAAIRNAASLNLTAHEMAQRFGISKERVKQLCAKAGVKPAAPPKQTRAASRATPRAPVDPLVRARNADAWATRLEAGRIVADPSLPRGYMHAHGPARRDRNGDVIAGYSGHGWLAPCVLKSLDDAGKSYERGAMVASVEEAEAAE